MGQSSMAACTDWFTLTLNYGQGMGNICQTPTSAQLHVGHILVHKKRFLICDPVLEWVCTELYAPKTYCTSCRHLGLVAGVCLSRAADVPM
jgi:hypothetical protein